jgi:hypothetical protein
MESMLFTIDAAFGLATPLYRGFAEALKKGYGAYVVAITEPDAVRLRVPPVRLTPTIRQ